MEGRTALTTGANSGIGLATVIELARHGYRSVGSVRSRSKANAVKAAAREAGVAVETVLLDLADAEACEQVMKRLKPYALVNNAGHSITGAIEDIDDAEARSVLETMVVVPMRLARLALPWMREQGGGRIVNISSIFGRTTTPLNGWYQAAKHALEGVSDALRVEVASSGVRVILIEPGGFKTGIWDASAADVERRQGSRYRGAYDRMLRGTALSQPFMGDPASVARVIASAVDSSRPRQRYLVGLDAQWLAAVDVLVPGRVRDRVTRVALGL
jgi:NAD(P)-dependent dehydrogenase (short-subunit alcohol dehydrogenase family)